MRTIIQPLSLDAFRSLPLAAISSKDAVLLLWTPSPKLSEAIGLMCAWGCDYRDCLVWVKDRIGMGHYVRQQHELLLLGHKGTWPLLESSPGLPSVITAARGRHSEKTACIYEVLEEMYPTYSKIELFSRAGARPGWSVWGNEVPPSP